jgi:hypothetical protein
MSGTELTIIQNQLKYMVSREQHIAGPYVDTTLAAVMNLSPTSATVEDCYRDPSYLVNNRTGQAENTPINQRVLARVNLSAIAGKWKVTEYKTLQVGCTRKP